MAFAADAYGIEWDLHTIAVLGQPAANDRWRPALSDHLAFMGSQRLEPFRSDATPRENRFWSRLGKIPRPYSLVANGCDSIFMIYCSFSTICNRKGLMDKKRLQELAVEGLQAQKERIELEIRALTRAVGAFASTITSGQAPEKRRKNRSAEQRKAQSARMKAYWARDEGRSLTRRRESKSALERLQRNLQTSPRQQWREGKIHGPKRERSSC